MGHGRIISRAAGTVVLAAALAVVGLGNATAAPTGSPETVRRLAASIAPEPGHGATAHGRTGSRQTLRVAGVPAGDDEESFLAVDPGCAKGSGKARPNAVVYSATRLTLDYTLTGPGALHRTGTVEVKKNRPTSVGLSRLRAGSYRVVLTAHDGGTVIADEAFDVARCVVVKASCHAITLTNPAGNPAALVGYGRSTDDFEVEVAAGTSRAVRIDQKKVRVEAWSTGDTFADLGSTTVKVKQSCHHGPAEPSQNAVQTTVVASCVAAAPADTYLFWSAQASLTDRRWEVLDDQQHVVAHGSYKNGRHTTAALAAGTYAYRSFANGTAQPFEDLSFTVLGCLTVTPRCRALDVANPNATDVQLLVFDTDADADPGDDSNARTIAASATTTIDWTSTTAAYLGYASGTSETTRVISLATEFGDDLPEVTVPQHC